MSELEDFFRVIGIILTAGFVVFITAFVSGILVYAQVSPEQLLPPIFNDLCNITNAIPNGGYSTHICSNLLPLIDLILLIASLGEIITLTKLNPILIAIYVMGFIIGILYASANVTPVNLNISTTILSTSIATTSVSTTISSTSTSTTTIPQYTNCLSDPQTKGFIPLNCSDPKPASSNTISFNFTLCPFATPIYNVNLACSVFVERPSSNQFYPLLQNGTLNLNKNIAGNTLWPGQVVNVKGLLCNSNSIETSFEGYIWINFSRIPGHGVQSNQWQENRTFDIFINASLSSYQYNQTKNLTGLSDCNT